VLRRRIARRAEEAVLEPVVDAATLLSMQAALEDVAVEDSIGRYIVDLTGATREHPSVLVGASPRGSLALLLLSRARAALAGRDYVIPEDVKEVAVPALSHRITLRPEMWLRRVDPSFVVAEVLAKTPAPASGAMPTYAS
jgi:MoxR-like ATPase